MSERRAIYTVVVGDPTRELAKITIPRMQRYARRCGADFVVYEKDTIDGPYFSKFDAIIEACERGYDRLLYLDADVLVVSEEEDVFDSYTCALQNEFDCPGGEVPPILQCAFAEIRRNFDPKFAPPYYNSGVILLDRRMLEPLAKRLKEIERVRLVLWEQCQLNWHLRVLGAPDQDLPTVWNYQYGWTQRDNRTVFPDDLRLLHFCGNIYSNKAELAERVHRQLGFP